MVVDSGYSGVYLEGSWGVYRETLLVRTLGFRVKGLVSATVVKY